MKAAALVLAGVLGVVVLADLFAGWVVAQMQAADEHLGEIT